MRKTKSTYQVFIIYWLNLAGVEGSEGISSITVSPSKKYVAICEKAERALCMVWDISGVSANPVV